MIGRRQAIGWLAAAPVIASTWSVPVRASTVFAPPQGPMQLSRVLVRHLSDGKTITVERHWRVAFQRLGRGYAVSGEQTRVDVKTPPALAALARIEQERVEESMFPLTLDGRGYLIAEGSKPTDEALTKAVAVVQASLARTSADLAGLEQFVATLRSAGQEMLSNWPAALFNPAGSTGTFEQAIPGPGPLPGLIRVSIEARTDHLTGLMERLDRTIETRVGDSVRLSQESWTLSA